MKKKILIILGHSDNKSFCAAIANIYFKKLSQTDNNEVRKNFLGEMKFDPILYKGYKEIQELEPDLKKAQKDILWADHLIFIYPVWWMNMPAILKGFCDRIFLPGFAFKYIHGVPIGLFKKKTAEIIITADGPNIFYKFFGGKIAIKVLKKNILRFCGIKTKKVKIYSNILNRDKKELLEKIKNKL